MSEILLTITFITVETDNSENLVNDNAICMDNPNQMK